LYVVEYTLSSTKWVINEEVGGKLSSMEWGKNEDVGEIPHIYTTACGVKVLESKHQ
jgi:hypothetical protein